MTFLLDVIKGSFGYADGGPEAPRRLRGRPPPPGGPAARGGVRAEGPGVPKGPHRRSRMKNPL